MFQIIFILFLYFAKSTNGGSRIMGGEPEDINNIPFQLSMWNDIKNIHYCGATLISPKWALTAGHCVKVFPLEQIYVRYGSSDSTKGGQLIKIINEYRPRHYNHVKKDYDIGAIKLDDYQFDPNKCVPIANCKTINWNSRPFDVQISGWGVNDVEDEKMKNILQKTRLKIIDNYKCFRQYMVPPYNFDVTSRMMCAMSKKASDACQGDSGGPVTYMGELIGLVSSGYGCAKPGFPGIYVNISDYSIRNWIKETTQISAC